MKNYLLLLPKAQKALQLKRMVTVILFTLLITHSYAQGPNWLWAKSAGGTTDDQAYGVTTDASGNVYVTGYFSSPSITFGTTTLTNAGQYDMFIVKYDGSGNVLWAKSVGGPDYDYGYQIAADANGNAYVTGSFFSDTITFDTTTLTNAGVFDMFIAKFDGSGNVLWAKGAGGTNTDGSSSVSVDGSGNVYLSGAFESPSITFGTTTLTNAGMYDIFIVKYDSSGNVLWAKGTGGTNYDGGTGVSADGSGNVYVTGYFSSSSITFGTTTLTNAGQYDVFIVKYDGSGNVLWAKSAGGFSLDDSYGVSVDGSGNVYVTGYFSSSSITFGTTTLTNAGVTDIFIVKYDSSGNVLWAKRAGGSSYDGAASVSADGNGNVYVTGYFGSSSINFGTTTLTNAGVYNMFIVKYDGSGNVLWAKSAGGTIDDYSSSVDADTSGNVYLTGFFYSPSITFGTTTLTNAKADSSDIFIVRLDGITGIEENNFKISVRVFPNPFSNQATLYTDKHLNNATLIVENIIGQTVKQIENVSGQTITLNRDNLPEGVYLVRISEGNKIIATDKLVITN